MCKRTTTDPLVKLFLERYHVNLLPLPREHAHCGELYLKRSRARAAVPGRIDELLEPPVALETPMSERLADLGGARSAKIEARFGLGLLEGFLLATGLGGGVVSELSAGYAHAGARSVGFRLADATRERVDPFALGTAIARSRLKLDHPWIGTGNRYYVTAGVIRSSSLTLRAEDEHSNAVEADVELLATADAKARVAVSRSDDGEVTYHGTESLAIGVELYELRFGENGRLTSIGERDVTVRLRRLRPLRHVRPQPPQPAFPADDDEALLVVEDEAGSGGG